MLMSVNKAAYVRPWGFRQQKLASGSAVILVIAGETRCAVRTVEAVFSERHRMLTAPPH
jgi:hypothetical protein